MLAACRHSDTGVFYPDTDDGANHGRAAKAACMSCPVAAQCLDYAIGSREEFGIWGGAGEKIRRGLRSKLNSSWDHYEIAKRQHLESLRAGTTHVVNRNGPNATHGKRATYANGCRCDLCKFGAALDSLRAKTREPELIAA